MAIKTSKKATLKLAYDTEIGGEMVPAGETVTLWADQIERIKTMHEKRQQAEAKQEVK